MSIFSTVQPLLLLEWSVPTLVVVVLWCSHLTLNILGLSALWSDTFVEIVTNDGRIADALAPSLDENGRIELYQATFKDNVKQFWDADAGAVAAVLIFSGLVQPAIKCVVLGLVAFRPMSLENRERFLEVQEATSKLTTAPFYVEAILLMAFTYTYTMSRLDLRAKIYMELYVGLLFFFIAQLNSFVLINVLRVYQRSKVASVVLARLHSKSSHHNNQRSSSSYSNSPSSLLLSPALAVPADGEDSKMYMKGGTTATSQQQQAVTARRTNNNNSNVGAGGLSESLLPDDPTRGFSPLPPLTTSLAGVVGSGGGGVGVACGGQSRRVKKEGEVFGRDSQGRQMRRDLRKAAVVLPCSVACIGCFFYVYTHPFMEFNTSGLFLGVTDQPTQKMSLKDVADGVMEKSHPFPYAVFFTFWFFMNLVVVPTAVPILAMMDAVLPLLPHLGRKLRHRRSLQNKQQQQQQKQQQQQQQRHSSRRSTTTNNNTSAAHHHYHESLVEQQTDTQMRRSSVSSWDQEEWKPPVVESSSSSSSSSNPSSGHNNSKHAGGGGGGGCLSSTLFNRAWTKECRRVIQDGAQLMAVWGTGEAAVVAVFFLAPNIDNVAHWVFDGMGPCPTVDSKTGGAEECVAVSATILATGGTMLVVWVLLYLFLVRVLMRGRKSLSGLLLAPLHQPPSNTDSGGGSGTMASNKHQRASSGVLVANAGGMLGSNGLDDDDEEGCSAGLLGEYGNDYDEFNDNDEEGGGEEDDDEEETYDDDKEGGSGPRV
jgi:hypothetical protein